MGGQIERKKIWRGKTKKINKINDKNLAPYRSTSGNKKVIGVI
jgi:hypothetical protein